MSNESSVQHEMNGLEYVMSEELTGRELDAAIAEKVMGWRRRDGEWWEDSDGEIKELVIDYCPSDDIAAAMMVVEKMRQSDKWCCIQIHSDYNYVWKVSFTRAGRANEAHKVTASATDELLPLAICRAALAAIEGDTTDK